MGRRISRLTSYAIKNQGKGFSTIKVGFRLDKGYNRTPRSKVSIKLICPALKNPFIVTSVMLLLALNVSRPAYGVAVFDASNYARMGQMLTSAGEQLGKLQVLSNQLGSMNNVLGSHLPSSVSGALGRMEGLGGEFGGLLSGISSPYADSLSTVNAFTSRHGAPDFSRFLIAKNFIRSKLFAENGEGRHDSRPQPLTLAQHDEIRSERTHVMKESSINSFALSSQQKNSVKKSHQQIEELAGQACQSSTIHGDLQTTNKLLAFIAAELVQQRALIAQQLELNAAVIAEQMPLVFKSTSLARQPLRQPAPTSNPWGQ
jgi:conjugal transfer/entry exclusion protein